VIDRGASIHRCRISFGARLDDFSHWGPLVCSAIQRIIRSFRNLQSLPILKLGILPCLISVNRKDSHRASVVPPDQGEHSGVAHLHTRPELKSRVSYFWSPMHCRNRSFS
jgi:hypothetical protein